MIIDQKGKLFGKISIIDIIIVLVILAAVAGVGYRYMNSKTATPFAANTDDLLIQFYAEEAPEFAAKAIKMDDIGKDPVKNSIFGKVTDIKIGKSASWAQSDQGQYVLSSKDGYSSVYVTLEGKGVYSDTGVKFDNDYYYIGKQMEVRVGNVALWVRVSDIKKKG